jgi:ribosomal protein S18 acetylase RimI-like enzyme
MTFSIRPAKPGDADFLAWAILAAARGHLARGWFDIVLARPEALCLAYIRHLTLSEAKAWWHYALFDVAEVDGEPVSALCTFAGTDVYERSAAAMEEASRAMNLGASEHEKLWPRGAFILSCTTGEDDALTVENVATLRAHRGRGVTAALLRHALERARSYRLPRAQISFLIGNEPAGRCYAKAGFTFAEEKRSEEFQAAMGVPGLRRLARDL